MPYFPILNNDYVLVTKGQGYLLFSSSAFSNKITNNLQVGR